MPLRRHTHPKTQLSPDNYFSDIRLMPVRRWVIRREAKVFPWPAFSVLRYYR
jgi:hypothetical protein